MKDFKPIKSEIIQLDKQLDAIKSDTESVNTELVCAAKAQNEQRQKQNDLLEEMDALAKQMGIIHEVHSPSAPIFLNLDREFDDFYNHTHTVVKRFPSLTPIEWIYASVAGILAAAIDVIFVGTPEVVKIYKSRENFDGSRLTALLRQIGSDPNSNAYAVLHWLSDKCKVPYDLSAVSGVVTPDNHRLRGLAHDPLFGLFFAVADILLGTTTCIDNNGHLCVLIGKYRATTQEKLLSVFYYIGHILSDICTARGIPIPGFFLTQFFTGDGSADSIARKAEMMYRDGYDMRHMASTAVPVIVKNLLIDAYLKLSSESDDAPVVSIAEAELSKKTNELKRDKMLFISDCAATGGNLGKILLPPSCGNPASINLTQWAAFIKSSLTMVSAATRDMSAETVAAQRKDIDNTWEHLLSELQ